MRTAIAFVAVLAMLVAARAKPLECVLWPKTCATPIEITPEPLPAPVSVAPAAQPQPTVAPPPTVAHAPRPKVVAAKPRPRIKAKFAKPKRKAPQGVVRWWCAFAPAGTTAAQIMSEAKSRNRTVSPPDAEACAASKRT